jgi:hypothetical protein
MLCITQENTESPGVKHLKAVQSTQNKNVLDL